MRSIDECMAYVLPEIDQRFRDESKQWPLVKRNLAITAHNRFMAEHGEWLGLDPAPMPLEKPEAA